MARRRPWHLAQALETLRTEVDEGAPQRSRVSDGGIGDAAHSPKTSDHNPCACCEAVCAFDFTHDPKGGLDCQALADFLQQTATSGDVRIKYVIFRKQIMSGPNQPHPCGVWRPYTGRNAHTRHLHLSVVHEHGETETPWGWPPPPAPAP